MKEELEQLNKFSEYQLVEYFQDVLFLKLKTHSTPKLVVKSIGNVGRVKLKLIIFARL